MMANATTQTAIEKASNVPHSPSQSERDAKWRQHYPTTMHGATVLVTENGATDPDLLVALTPGSLQLSERTGSDVIDDCAFSAVESLEVPANELTGRLYLAERPTTPAEPTGDALAGVADA
jgi:hypothetical protein